MKSKSLQDLYYDEIKDLYDAENRIVKTIPKLVKASSSEELQDDFNDHLQKTRGHVERLQRIFAGMGKKPTAKTCNGMKGILEEGAEALELEAGAARDAALIAGAQRVEHYEMAAYGTVKTWAGQLDRSEDSELLQQTLDEEKEADETLTGIAESGINAAAEEDSERSSESEDPKEDSERDDAKSPAKTTRQSKTKR
jgi:ferritin-like metal-binding protein YciE